MYFIDLCIGEHKELKFIAMILLNNLLPQAQ